MKTIRSELKIVRNKFGFTVVEIIIVLALIGVISALTIPTLATQNRKNVLASSLSAAVSNFENATTSLIMKTPTITDLSDLSEDDFLTKLREVMSFAGTYTTTHKETDKDGNSTDVSDVFYLSTNGNAYNINVNIGDEASERTVLQQGGNLTQQYATVTIDVNGKNIPNHNGRDIFYFVLGVDGVLYPVGGKDWAIYTGEDENYTSCNVGDENCAAYLIHNNYKMDY
jgi:prepilin-type N-terminal cleavage/methylation domain-containing protein